VLPPCSGTAAHFHLRYANRISPLVRQRHPWEGAAAVRCAAEESTDRLETSWAAAPPARLA
jgi:hypothetical protein